MTTYQMPELPEDYRFQVLRDKNFFIIDPETSEKIPATHDAYVKKTGEGWGGDAEESDKLVVVVERNYKNCVSGAYVQKRFLGIFWKITVWDSYARQVLDAWRPIWDAKGYEKIAVHEVELNEEAIARAAESLVPQVQAYQEGLDAEAERTKLLNTYIGTYPPKQLDKLNEDQ